MASILDPDTNFLPTNKPTIAAGDVENGALAEANYLQDADTWQAELLYGGPCNVSMFIDDLLEDYTGLLFVKPTFADRCFVGVIATGGGDVTVKHNVDGVDYFATIGVANSLEPLLTDGALANASTYWQDSNTPLIMSDAIVSQFVTVSMKRAAEVRVFGVVVKWYRSSEGL